MEIAIVAVIGLLVFGPKRLPELGRSVGSGLREFRGSVTGLNPAPDAVDADEAERPVDHRDVS